MKFESVLADEHIKKAEARVARVRGVRKRVCLSCVQEQDEVLGNVHSELDCMRCGAVPCDGVIVLAPVTATAVASAP
jgi:hypothetical protein